MTFLPHNEYTNQLPDEPGSVWEKLIPRTWLSHKGQFVRISLLTYQQLGEALLLQSGQSQEL